MGNFSADWLTLREPYDARARNPAVLDAVVASVRGFPSMRIVDLASGIGSTLRALAPRLAARQNWRLVDNNHDLLACATTMARSETLTVEARTLDLNCNLKDAFDGPPIDLVTAFALFDLVSETWLERLLLEIVRRSVPLYSTLNYDGRTELEPADPLDSVIVAAMNAHQRTDKGFGSALGPMAAPTTIARLEAMEYSVARGASDWVIGPDDREIQMKVFAVWASAADRISELSRSDRIGWLTRRRDAVITGRSSIRVGHVDFFATPIGTRGA